MSEWCVVEVLTRPLVHLRHLDRATLVQAVRPARWPGSASTPRCRASRAPPRSPRGRWCRSSGAAAPPVRSVVIVASRSRRYSSAGVCASSAPSRSHRASGRAETRSRTRWRTSGSSSGPVMASSSVSATLLAVCSTVAACRASDRGSGPRESQPTDQVREGEALDQQGAGHDDHRRRTPATSRSPSSSGISNAVASVTTPRRPAQSDHDRVATTGVFAVGVLSRDSDRRRPPITQTIRITITPSSTATQNAAIRAAPRSLRPRFSTSWRACRPISRNTVFSSRNWMVVQLTPLAESGEPALDQW